MEKKNLFNSLIFLAIFIFSVISIEQTISISAKKERTQQGVLLKILVSDQQAPDIEMWKQHIIDNSNGLIANITVVSTAERTDDQFTQLQTLFGIGSSEFDIISMDVIWPAKFANDLVDLTDIFNQTFRDGIIKSHSESMVWNEKVIAGPFFFDSGLVLYRKDILERNGFTIDNFTTWTNWKVNLNKMLDNATEAALNPNLEGYAFQGDSYEGGIVNLIEWMGASGGSFVNSAGKANFVASAVPALTWMKGLVPITPPIFLPPLLNANPLNNPIGDFVSKRSELVGDEDSAVTTWLAGNTIFQRNWPFSQKSSSIDAIMNGSQVLKFENGTIYNANLIADPWFVNHPNESRFGVTTLPYNAEHCGAENEQGCRSAVSGGAVFGIPKTSMHIEQAKLFLQEIASKPFQLAMAINGSGNSPFSKEIYIDGSLNGTSQEFKIELFQSVFIHTFPRPILPEYVTISQTIQPIYHNGFSGALSVLEALAEMDLQVNIILGNILPTNTITVRENFTVNFTVTNQVTKTVTTPAFDLLIIILTLGVFRFKASRRKLKKITSKSGH